MSARSVPSMGCLPVGPAASQASANKSLAGLTVYAQVEAVIPPVIHSLLTFEITLAVRIKISSPLVGRRCYIGSRHDPILLRLSAGSGPGTTARLIDDPLPPGVLGLRNVHIGATDFSVPAARGTGPFGAFNGIVNAMAGLPNPGVGSSVRLSAAVFLGPNPRHHRV